MVVNSGALVTWVVHKKIELKKYELPMSVFSRFSKKAY